MTKPALLLLNASSILPWMEEIRTFLKSVPRPEFFIGGTQSITTDYLRFI